MLRRNWRRVHMAGNSKKRAFPWAFHERAGQLRPNVPLVGGEMDLPPKQGLYDPRNEHDAAGVGFVANIKGARAHEIIGLGLQLLINLDHRGAVGADPLVGDGASILIQIPDLLFRDCTKETGVTLPPPRQYAGALCFLPREAKAREIVDKHFEHFIKFEGEK